MKLTRVERILCVLIYTALGSGLGWGANAVYTGTEQQSHGFMAIFAIIGFFIGCVAVYGTQEDKNE